MNTYVSRWLHNKSVNGYYPIRKPVLVEVGEPYSAGSLTQRGRLTVRGIPNEEFDVVDSIEWSIFNSSYAGIISIGLMDYCLAHNHIPVLGVQFELVALQVDGDPMEDADNGYWDSSDVPFYYLGRRAAEKVITIGEVDYKRRIDRHFLTEELRGNG